MPPDADQESRRSEPGTSASQGEGSTFFGLGKPRLLGVLLFLLVANIFLPALRHDFIYYDDPGFVMENPHVVGVHVGIGAVGVALLDD